MVSLLILLNLIELHAGYAFFLEKPEGGQAVPFFRLIVASHSIKDTMTQFQSTLTWLGMQHVEGASLVENFQSINAGCEDLIANFCGPDGLLDPKIMASMLSVACLPKHKFSHFIHQLFFKQNTDIFVNTRQLQSDILTYEQTLSGAFKLAEQDQAYVAIRGNKGSPAAAYDENLYCITCFEKTGK
jgi:hypothetical protein